MANLPINQFITERLNEFDPNFELRPGTGFEGLFIKPLQFILQPLRDEADEAQVGQSFRRILETDNPDAFNEEWVDANAGNLFVERREGGRSSGLARAYYDSPVTREYPASGAVFTGSNGQTYSNPAPFRITSAQMSSQTENGLFYFDIPVQSDETGADTALDVGGLVSLLDDPDVINVNNINPITGGLDRETNTEIIDRSRNSIGVRDLVAGKGFNGILFENFKDILFELQPIGFGDNEMMRDIVFNTHIGGRVDGFFRAPNILTKSQNFIGLLIDPTRQTLTSTNVQLFGTNDANLGNPTVDRSNGLVPIVTQIKSSVAAEYTSTADLSSPIDLSTNQHIRLGIDGVERNIRVAGVNPATTNRNEIISLINAAVGVNVAFPSGDSLVVRSNTVGLASSLTIANPTIGNSALLEVFGLAPGAAPYTFLGDGPITFVEGVHYEINDGDGTIKRILGSVVLTTQTTGETTEDSNVFVDNTAGQFVGVQVNDIITITSGADAGDYRVIDVINNNQIQLDAALTANDTGINYNIRRTGIKNEEVVNVRYYFNPLSIDIGKLIKLDPQGKARGIRPGREGATITDLAFLRIRQIELIDPISEAPLGQVLDGKGGYGQGGYGMGPYGVGSGADYRLIVNSPTERFSMFEDSYIVINSAFQAQSFRVTFDYVPEVEVMHTFVRSENERVLDGDILMRHFLPTYVSGVIEYSVDPTDINIPSNDVLQSDVHRFINQIKQGIPLEYSDIIQFIKRKTDPFDRYGSFVRIFELEGTIHHTDGTISKVTGKDSLEIPEPDPFPKETSRPISPRIARWIADEVILVRKA